jgi:hypothetical protein
VLLSLAFVGAVVAALIHSTMNLAQYRVEVCMDYQGRSSCRTAAGSTEEFALRSATDNACALIASGVTDTMGCGRTPPRSVRWIKRP